MDAYKWEREPSGFSIVFSFFFFLPFNTEMGIASIYMVEGMAAPSSARHIQNYIGCKHTRERWVLFFLPLFIQTCIFRCCCFFNDIC